MIFKCEQCEQQYSVDYSKMKGELISFNCTACGNKIDATKPHIEAVEESGPPIQDVYAPPPLFEEKSALTAEPVSKEKKERSGSPRLRLGLLGKMLFLIVLIPLVTLSLASYYVWHKMGETTNVVVEEGSRPALLLAKREINAAASEVARQVGFYLSQHPELTREQIRNDPALRKIVLPPVLRTGQASLYVRYGEGEGTFVIAHEPKLEGQPITRVVQKGRLRGSRYDELGKIIRLGGAHREAASFFLARDPDGILKERVVTYAPISGTPYGIMATTYTDDFMEPVQEIQTKVKDLFREVQYWGFLGPMLIAFLIIAVIIILYTVRITGRIKALTDVANHISLGELGIETDIRANDEIGDLGSAISRMQDSLILSIERLRRRR
ncbi:HAMP domain-containing protein [Thermodesulfobacteriota bacterium]